MQELLKLRRTRRKNSYRIPSGVPGLDELVNGGLRSHTVNVVVAEAGCGKSTFAWQFATENKEIPCLFLSLEQDIDRVLRETESMGLHGFREKYERGNLQFQFAYSDVREMTSGEVALNFLLKELPKHLNLLKEKVIEYHGGLRVVVDPLTPLLFEVNDLKQQRNAITRIFNSLRSIGTSVITLEKGFGESLTRVPLFLADSILDLEFLGLGGVLNRMLRIKKFRGSSHSEMPHPVEFVQDKGLLIHNLESL